ncbi:MAG TPA: type IV secretion system DNA-binding domain-containing protein [Actinomycetota bacterium]|nr:type IV secretion system DNA-binding domain-containing protein [Actinomycetota bacterium]
MRRPVAIGVEDARHHLHVVGETRTGKSTLLANLVLQDAAAGRAAVVIDPKGDLVESILERIPKVARTGPASSTPTTARTPWV